MFCTLCFQFIKPMSQSSNIDRCLAMFIFLIGAPCFFLVNVLNSLLDCIFPEGWDIFKILVMILSSYGAACMQYSSDFTVMKPVIYILLTGEDEEWTKIMKNQKALKLA